MLSKREQSQFLQQVSRSFALSIPLLNKDLEDVIANAYLLCRIADTIEDNPKACLLFKIKWLEDFAHLCDELFDDDNLIDDLVLRAKIIKDSAVFCEYELLTKLKDVTLRTKSFDKNYLKIVAKGVSILSRGMAEHLSFVANKSLDDVDSYCYAVAGVVGEMLARLFALNENIDALSKAQLVDMSVSFGEGLQLTNILKDRSEDIKRGVTFLAPLDNFKDKPKSFSALSDVSAYICITYGHLLDAIDFVCKLPKDKSGTRMFCLVNIIMAILTLNKIAKNPQAEQSLLKISRQDVYRIFIYCKVFKNCNFLVKLLARRAGSDLKPLRRDFKDLYEKVSKWN